MQRERRVLGIHGVREKHEFISFKLLYLTSKGRILYIGEFSEKIGHDPYLFSKAKDKDTTT